MTRVYIPVSEHLAQTSLLVGTDDCRRLEINIEIRVDRVVSEIVLLEHWIFQFVASFFHILSGRVEVSE